MAASNAGGTVLSLACKRRSVREYRRDPVNLDDVLYAIKAALQAPSGANLQPWRFIIVEDRRVKAKIREVCEEWEKRFHESPTMPAWFRNWLKQRGITWRKDFLTDAPVLVAVAAYKKAPYARESTWLAIGYLLLALEERGLASLTYTPPNPGRVAALLGIPEDYTLETIIPVGFPEEDKAKEPRMSLREAVYLNSWGMTLPEGVDG